MVGREGDEAATARKGGDTPPPTRANARGEKAAAGRTQPRPGGGGRPQRPDASQGPGQTRDTSAARHQATQTDGTAGGRGDGKRELDDQAGSRRRASPRDA